MSAPSTERLAGEMERWLESCGQGKGQFRPLNQRSQFAKGELPASVVSPVGTPEKGSLGAAVGADMDGDAAVNAGIISSNALGDSIAIAGEAIIVGTAVYFAQEWVRSHGQDIKNWTDAAGHFVGSVATEAFHDGEKLLSWFNPL